MKKIIHCIIISLIFLAHLNICAEETMSYTTNTTALSHKKKVYEKTVETSTNRIGYVSGNRTIVDSLAVAKVYFYRNEADNQTLYVENLVDTDNKGSQIYPNPEINFQQSFATTDVALQGNSGAGALHKSCTPFIIAMIFLLSIIIAFIILRRIKTNTLKLF